MHEEQEKIRELGKGIESVRRLGSPEGQTMKQSSQSKGTVRKMDVKQGCKCMSW